VKYKHNYVIYFSLLRTYFTLGSHVTPSVIAVITKTEITVIPQTRITHFRFPCVYLTQLVVTEVS